MGNFLGKVLVRYLGSVFFPQWMGVHQERFDSTDETRTLPQKRGTQCRVCEKQATLFCQQCLSAGYCDLNHQNEDFQKHESECPSFLIRKSNNLGLEWVATRRLEENVLLLEETPVVQTLLFSQPFFEGLEPSCLTCGIVSSKLLRCTNCSWPICSLMCESDPIHSQNECQEFIRRKLVYPLSCELGPKDSLKLIFFMRAVALAQRDLPVFSSLMELQDWMTIPPLNQKLIEDSKISMNLLQILSDPNSLQPEEFQKLWRILKVNSFEAEIASAPMASSQGPSPRQLCILFLKVSRMNHSCSPNCHLTVGPGPEYKVRVRTSAVIKEGESLVIDFYSLDFLTTWRRHAHIRSVGGFLCKCRRCLDPTELGTMTTGIRHILCPRLKGDNFQDGFFIPMNPLDLSTLNPCFKCNGCSMQSPLLDLIAKLPKAVQKAFPKAKIWMGLEEGDSISLQNCVNGIMNLDKFVHPHHWINQSALRQAIANGRSNFSSNGQFLEHHVRQLQILGQIYGQLFATLHKIRGNNWEMMATALLLLLQTSSSKMKPPTLKKWVNLCMLAHNEALRFNQLEWPTEPSKTENESSLKFQRGKLYLLLKFPQYIQSE